MLVSAAATALAVAPIGLLADDSGMGVTTGIVLALGLGVAISQTASLVVFRRTGTTIRPGDVVTLLRTGLVAAACGWALLIALGALPSRTWWLFGIATLAWLLDGVDGWVARRTGTTTDTGARLDMEVDALLLLALSVAAVGVVGWWVLAIGLMRYLWWVVLWCLPHLDRPLPARRSRKVVAALQGGVLCAVLLPTLPVPVVTVASAVALTLLTWSFVTDGVRAARLSRTGSPAPS